MRLECITLAADELALDSRVVVFDAHDAAVFKRILWTTGIPLLIFTLFAWVILKKCRFKLSRLRSMLACAMPEMRDNDTFHFWLSVRLGFVYICLALPILLLVVLAAQSGHALKKSSRIVGAALLLLPLSYGCLLFGFLHWSSLKWQIDRATKWCFICFVVFTYLFELIAIFNIQPTSFFSLSAMLLSLNGLIMTIIHFLAVEGHALPFADWVSTVLAYTNTKLSTINNSHNANPPSWWLPAHATPPPLTLENPTTPTWPILHNTEIRTACKRLYLLSLGVLCVYIVVAELLVHSALRSHCIAVVYTILVVDVTQYLVTVSSQRVTAVSLSLYALGARLTLFIFSYHDYARLECIEYSPLNDTCCVDAQPASSPTWFIGHSFVFFLLGTLSVRRLFAGPGSPTLFVSILAQAIPTRISSNSNVDELNSGEGNQATGEVTENSQSGMARRQKFSLPDAAHELVLVGVYCAYVLLILLIEVSNTDSMKITQFVYLLVNITALLCFGLITLTFNQFETCNYEITTPVVVCCCVVLVAGAAGGAFMWLITGHWLLLFLSSIVPVIIVFMGLTLMCWKHNKYSLFKHSEEQGAGLLSATFRGSLPTQDYHMIGLMFALTALCIVLGVVVGGSTGSGISLGIFVAMLTYAGLKKYLVDKCNFSAFSAVALVLAFVLVTVWCSVQSALASSLFVLTVGFVYPAMVALLLAIFRLSLDSWSLTAQSRALVAISAAIVIVYGFVIALTVTPWVVGGTIAFVWLMGVAKIFLYASYKSAEKQRKKPLSLSYLLIIPAIVFGLIVITSGHALLALVVVLVALLLACIAFTVYRLRSSGMDHLWFSAFVFPVFRFSVTPTSTTPKLKTSNKAVSFGFGALLVLVMIGHVTTVALEWEGGPAITCAMVTLAWMFGMFLTRRTNSAYLRDIVPFVTPADVYDAFCAAQYAQSRDKAFEIIQQHRHNAEMVVQMDNAHRLTLQNLQKEKRELERQCLSDSLALKDAQRGEMTMQTMLRKLPAIDKKINKLNDKSARAMAHTFLLLSGVAQLKKNELVEELRALLAHNKVNAAHSNLSVLSKPEIDLLLQLLPQDHGGEQA